MGDGGVQGLEKMEEWREHHSVEANMERKWRSNYFGRPAYLELTLGSIQQCQPRPGRSPGSTNDG